MASNDHTKNSTSPSSEYEEWKHIIDIDNKTEDPKTTEWNIYKVPCILRNLDNKHAYYTPQLVSIGPIHHGLEKLNPMQDQKRRYLKLFWSRRAKTKTEGMDKFKEYLEGKETNIRQCYAENISYDEKKLVEMMFLDSVFIMELFLRIQSQKSLEDDTIVKQSWLNKSIQRDLLLLENQIPLCILEELYNFVPDSDPVKMQYQTFIELACHYFECFHTYKKCDEETGRSDFKREWFVQLMMNCVTDKKGDTSSGEKTGSSYSNTEARDGPKHFTDLIRSFYICEDLPYPKEESPLKPLRTATKLREAGVSFEKVKNKHLLAIKFRAVPILSWFLCFGCIPRSTYFKARLQIPELKVDNTTECVLRNLIAFEQCHYPDEPYICNYVSFIDSLIHTKDDVELLVEKEVIVHELGSDKEVATLVNSLCKHVVTDKTCYKDVIDSLNKHYQRQWNHTMAALRLVYFKDAWRASSTLVATAVLVFTIFNFCRVVKLVFDLEGRRQP